MSEMIQVPDGWEVKPLKEFIQFIKDGTHGTHQDVDIGVPLLSAKDIDNGKIDLNNEPRLISQDDYNKIHKTYQIKINDILLTIVGTIGRVAIVDINDIFTLQRSVAILRTNKFLTSKLAYHILSSNEFLQKLLLMTNASAQGGIYLGSLSTLEIKVPKEKKEQEKIAKILSTLDKAIESTNRLIEKEKNIKIALMQELLTNGIDKNGQIRSPKTHTYKQSELGLVPDEWEVVSLEKIGNVITGNTPPTDNEDYYNGHIPFVGPVDLTGKKYISQTEKNVSKDGLNYSREIPKDSILTVCIGSTIGKIALTVKQCCTNQQINALVCDKKYFSEFIFYAMSQFLQRQLDIEAGLQAVPIVNKSSFAKLVLPCPLDLEEQKQIAKILTTQDKKIQTEETNLAKLKELKKGLMNDLLSGKVRVNV